MGGILGGLASLFGGAPPTTTKTNMTQTGQTNTSGTSNLNTSGSTTASTNPVLSALQKQLSTAAGDNAINANLQPTNLTGYTQQGLQNINSQNSDQALKANLEGSGMEYSPAAANAETSNTLNRVNQGNTFLAGVPLLQTQLQQQALQGLNSTFSTLPTATSSTGTSAGTATGTTTGSTNSTSTTNGTQTQSVNPIDSLLNSFGQIFALGNGGGTQLGSSGIFDPGAESGGYLSDLALLG